MRTRGTTTDRPTRPSWLPPANTIDAVAAGRWWDAIAVDGDTGRRAAELLRELTGARCGPIACDPLGPRWRTYFLVPAGTADRWDEPGSEALGECCYVGLPGNLTADRVGLHWVTPPDGGRLVRPALLRQVLAEARSGAS